MPRAAQRGSTNIVKTVFRSRETVPTGTASHSAM